MLELAQACIRVTGSSSEIVFEALPTDDPMVRRPDITRARQILGWEPEVDLDEGLRRWIQALGYEPVEALSLAERDEDGAGASAPGRSGAPPATREARALRLSRRP